MGFVSDIPKVAQWVAIVATFLKCGLVRGIEAVGAAGIGTICVALLVRIQTFLFHAMAINARDMVITPPEVERSPDETEFPFTLFFPQAPLTPASTARAAHLHLEQRRRNAAEHCS